MKDELITFETAKLAKDKGFEAQLYTYYNSIGNVENEPKAYVRKKYSKSPNWLGADTINDFEGYIGTMDNSMDSFFLAPTQSLLQRWLRDVHKINVEPILVYKDHNFNTSWKLMYDSRVVSIVSNEIRVIRQGYLYDTYELALESGLLKALELI